MSIFRRISDINKKLAKSSKAEKNYTLDTAKQLRKDLDESSKQVRST